MGDDFLNFNTSNWSKGMTYDRDPTVHQKWNRETGGEHLLNDKYAGYNMDDNVGIWDGILYLRNEKENIIGTSPVGNFEYTTGWINSLRKRTVSPNTYLEIRAKFPVGPKVWPAIWLVPDSLETWPPEIDIWEYFGTLFTENVQDKMLMRYIYGTSSTVTNYGTFASVSDHSSRLSGGFNERFGATSWHVYGWEWTPTIMVWYIDDVEVHRKSRGIDIPDTKWPDTDFALIINNGLLSKAPTCIDSWQGSSCTTFPNKLAIDYIKINQCIDDQYPFYVSMKHGKQDCDFIAKQDNKSRLCEWMKVRQKCPITCSGECTPSTLPPINSPTVSPTNSRTACIDNPENFYFGKEMKKRFGKNLGNCEFVAKPENKSKFCHFVRIRKECQITCEECLPECVDHPDEFYVGKKVKLRFEITKVTCKIIDRHKSKEILCQHSWIRSKCPLVCDACPQPTDNPTLLPTLHQTSDRECHDYPHVIYYGEKVASIVGKKDGRCKSIPKKLCQVAWIKELCPITCNNCSKNDKFPVCLDYPEFFYFGEELKKKFGKIYKKQKNCKFINSKSKKKKELYCSSTFIRNKCPLTCDACPVYKKKEREKDEVKCVDKATTIKLQDKVIKKFGKQNCISVATKKEKWCKRESVRLHCPLTCGVCGI